MELKINIDTLLDKIYAAEECKTEIEVVTTEAVKFHGNAAGMTKKEWKKVEKQIAKEEMGESLFSAIKRVIKKIITGNIYEDMSYKYQKPIKYDQETDTLLLNQRAKPRRRKRK